MLVQQHKHLNIMDKCHSAFEYSACEYKDNTQDK